MRTKSNVKKTSEKIKDAILGTDPDDRKLMLFLYLFGTFVFLFIVVIGSGLGMIAATLNNISPEVRWLTILAMYLGFMGALRLVLAAVKSSREFYLGKNSDEIQADDFSAIEALVAQGDYKTAINRYRSEFRERGGEDERPRMRIAEIYRLEMHDYEAALNQYALIARTSENRGARLQAYTHMIEIFRDKFPEDKRFELLCRKVMKEYPGSIACRLASEHLTTQSQKKGL